MRSAIEWALALLLVCAALHVAGLILEPAKWVIAGVIGSLLLRRRRRLYRL